jgi:hypothetical protein
MIIRKLAWSSCVLAALSLGGCMLDATGSGEDDGPLGAENSELSEGNGIPVPPESEPGAAVDPSDGDPLAPEEATGTSPTFRRDAVAANADPNEPHPDPWTVATAPEDGSNP